VERVTETPALRITRSAAALELMLDRRSTVPDPREEDHDKLTELAELINKPLPVAVGVGRERIDTAPQRRS
jgi:hypothetical protein